MACLDLALPLYQVTSGSCLPSSPSETLPARNLLLVLDQRGLYHCSLAPLVLLLHFQQTSQGKSETSDIREAEKEIASLFQVHPTADPQPVARQLKAPPLAHTERRGANSAEGWKLATPSTSRRMRLLLKPEVSLQSRFIALQTREERPVTSGGMLELSKAADLVPVQQPEQIGKRNGCWW